MICENGYFPSRGIKHSCIEISLLTDRFPRLLMIAVAMGSITSFFGAWASYYLDGATGGIIVVAQTLLFLLAFVFAPKHGLLASRRRARLAQEAHP